jgi:ribosomal protein L16/L10AE
MQIECVRRALVRQLRCFVIPGRLLVRQHANVPRSRRKVGLRMGGSKSPYSTLYCHVYAGAVLFEVCVLTCSFSANFLAVISRRLPTGIAIR